MKGDGQCGTSCSRPRIKAALGQLLAVPARNSPPGTRLRSLPLVFYTFHSPRGQPAELPGWAPRLGSFQADGRLPTEDPHPQPQALPDSGCPQLPQELPSTPT